MNNNNNNNNNRNNPNIRILNNEEEDDRVVRNTDFVLTINTNQLVTNQMDPVNQAYPDRYTEVVNTFNNMFEELLQLDNEEWGPANWIDFPGDDGVDNILDAINIVIAFERIPEGKPNAGRFHMHALVQIRHNSHISIATTRLFQLVRRFLAAINIDPYCYLRFARSSIDQVLEYMRKDLESGRSSWRRGGFNNNNNNYNSDTDEESF